MKCVYMTCNVSMLEIVTNLLDNLKFTDYQVIEQVTAKSSFSVPHLNTAVWPGYNSVIFVQENIIEKVSELIEEVNKMNETAFNGGELIALFVWNIETCSIMKKFNKA